MANTYAYSKLETDIKINESIYPLKQKVEKMGVKMYSTLAEAQSLIDKPENGTVFQVSAETDNNNSGYHVFQSSEPNGTLRDLDRAFPMADMTELKYLIGRNFSVNIPIIPRGVEREFWISIDNIVVEILEGDPHVYGIGYFNFTNDGTFFDRKIGITREDKTNNTFDLQFIQTPESWGQTGVHEVTADIFDVSINFTINLSQLNFGTVYLISNNSSGHYYKNVHINTDRYKTKTSSENIPFANKMFVKREGENLYTSYKINGNTDILMHFKKCMFNNLYTFYSIALKNNTSIFPADPQSGYDTALNVATSDNIGPILVSSGGGWTGGNHGKSTPNGDIKTAETISFNIYSDGVEVKDGDSFYAAKLEIQVVNNLYNPAKETNTGGVISLEEILCVETVIYQVYGDSIKVVVNHSFQQADPVTITYHGMQSMFKGENYLTTHNGVYDSSFESITNVMAFIKNNHPDFDRYIEKKDTVAYQSNYLFTDYGIGDHSGLSGTDNIFFRNAPKNYHRLTVDKPISNGDTQTWGGLYSWFQDAIQDDGVALVYEANMDGKTLLFIDIKQVFTGKIKLPSKYVLKDFSIRSQDASLSLGSYVEPLGIEVTTTGTGSVILEF